MRARSALGSRLRSASRKVHNVLAWIVAVPAVVILVTGIALQLRQDVEWIQPRSQMGSQPGIPVLSLNTAFEKAAAVKEAGIATWEDVSSLDVKPAKGIISVRAKSGFEVQVDGATGEVLSAAPRRTGLLIELHQGSFFHAQVMRWVFLPAGVGLLFLWITGMVMVIRRRSRGLVRVSG